MHLAKKLGQSVGSQAKKRRRLGPAASEAASFFTRFSSRGWCSCAMVLTSFRIAIPGAQALQPQLNFVVLALYHNGISFEFY